MREFRPYPKQFTPPKEKTPMKKVRTDDTGKLRRKLDLLFAKHIRAMSKKCFTCELEPSTECGHFMKRGNDSTRWLEDNARPQGFNCNRILSGNIDVFRERLIKEIGASRVKAIEELSKVAVKFSAPELQERIDQLEKRKVA